MIRGTSDRTLSSFEDIEETRLIGLERKRDNHVPRGTTILSASHGFED